MDLKQIECENENWIHPVEDNLEADLVKTIVNFHKGRGILDYLSEY
jgi:hypothetical protein